MNRQLKDLEEEMAQKEQMKEKTLSSWSRHVYIIIYIYYIIF
jgi:hypothetical protein